MSRAPLHPLLQEIFQRQPAAQNELGPWHLGGPQPCAPRRALAEIVIEVAQRHGGQKDEDQRILAAARGALARDQASIVRLKTLVGNPDRVTPTAAWYAGLAALHTSGRMRNLPRPARSAIGAVVAWMGKWQALELAVELDDLLMKAEVHGYLDRRKIPTRISNLAYRAGDKNGNSALWLTRTISTDGGEAGWGTLLRVKGLHWTEGGRDDALAAIPDEHLEAACAVVLGSKT
jgi:hypothetical protein